MYNINDDVEGRTNGLANISRIDRPAAPRHLKLANSTRAAKVVLLARRSPDAWPSPSRCGVSTYIHPSDVPRRRSITIEAKYIPGVNSFSYLPLTYASLVYQSGMAPVTRPPTSQIQGFLRSRLHRPPCLHSSPILSQQLASRSNISNDVRSFLQNYLTLAGAYLPI